MTERIGLVIWGCRGGWKIFCSNNVVDVNAEQIASTVLDVRNSIVIGEPGIDYYALEFTDDYKVFTQYRSSTDSGTGAFIALTVYVPHDLKIKNMRALLNRMTDAYFAEYISAVTKGPKPNMIVEIEPFAEILSKAEAVPDRALYAHSRSKQDATPKLLLYSSVQEVDRYYSNPYYPQFFDCQEVMFISEAIYNNPAEYSLGLQRTMSVFDKSALTPPEPEATILSYTGRDGVRLEDFTIEGQPASGDVPASLSDRIEFTFARRNYEPVHFSGTVSEAAAKGCLSANGRKYSFVAPALTPMEFVFGVVNSGDVPASEVRERLFLRSGRLQKRPEPGTNLNFLLAGDEIDLGWDVVFTYRPESPADGLNVGSIAPGAPSGSIAVDVSYVSVPVTFKGEVRIPESVSAYYNTGSGRKLDATMPAGSREFSCMLVSCSADPVDADSVRLSADGWDCRRANGGFVFKPELKIVRVSFYGGKGGIDKGDDLLYCSDGTEVKAEIESGKWIFRLLPEQKDDKNAVIRLNGEKLDYDRGEDNNSLTVYLHEENKEDNTHGTTGGSASLVRGDDDVVAGQDTDDTGEDKPRKPEGGKEPKEPVAFSISCGDVDGISYALNKQTSTQTVIRPNESAEGQAKKVFIFRNDTLVAVVNLLKHEIEPAGKNPSIKFLPKESNNIKISGPKSEKNIKAPKSTKMPIKRLYKLIGAIAGILVLLGLLVFFLFRVLGGPKDKFIPVIVTDGNAIEKIEFEDENLSFRNDTVIWNGKDVSGTANKVEFKDGPDGVIDQNQILEAILGKRDTICVESQLHLEYVVNIISAKADSAKAVEFAEKYPVYADSIQLYLESIGKAPVAAFEEPVASEEPEVIPAHEVDPKVAAAIAGLNRFVARLDKLDCNPNDTQAITDYIAAHPELPKEKREAAERKVKAYINFFTGDRVSKAPGMTQTATGNEFTTEQWRIIRNYYIAPAKPWDSKTIQDKLNEKPRSFNRVQELKDSIGL